MGVKKRAMCTDARGENCLMRMKNGLCNGLDDTSNCTFFKDKRRMTETEIEEYMSEAYKIGYIGSVLSEQARLQKIGEKILLDYELDTGCMVGRKD